MTPENLVYLIGVGLSVVFEYFPRLKDWYDKKSEGSKRAIMALLLAVGAVVVVVAPCYDFISLNLACTVVGFVGGATKVILLFLQAVAINQGFHRLTKRTRDNAPTG